MYGIVRRQTLQLELGRVGAHSYTLPESSTGSGSATQAHPTG